MIQPEKVRNSREFHGCVIVFLGNLLHNLRQRWSWRLSLRVQWGKGSYSGLTWSAFDRRNTVTSGMCSSRQHQKKRILQAQSLSQRPWSLPTPSAAVCNHSMPRGVEDTGASKKKIEFWPVTTIKYNNLSLQGWFSVQEEVRLWWEATYWASVKLTFGVFATGGLLTTEGTCASVAHNAKVC